MKVAIVCGHFVPQLGYIEVHLARALHEAGNEVMVVTSNKTSHSAKHLKQFNQFDQELPYAVVRLSAWFSAGQIVRSKGINSELNRFQPDKVIVIGLGKIFPKEVFKAQRKFELITLLGDNEDTYNSSQKSGISSLKKSILQSSFKNPLYKKAVEHSDRLIGYTPSTLAIVSSIVGDSFKGKLKEKYSESSLGFFPEEFNAIETTPTHTFITATRITPTKKIEKVIDGLKQLKDSGLHFNYKLIGFTEDDYGQELKKYIQDKGMEQTVECLPFVPRENMNEHYNSADVGIWTQTAISVFEGAGSGLYLVLPQKQNLSHVIESEKDGLYFNSNNLVSQLQKTLDNLDTINANRNIRVENMVSRFSYQQLLQLIFS